MRGKVWPGRAGGRRAIAEHAARRGEGSTADWGQGTEERTWNMEPISMLCVMPEVSKLSGWLNADAYCRESKRGHAVRDELRGPGGGRRRATAVHAQRAGEGSTADSGAGHREERTPNIQRMSVTLEVSKLSGWLNADACCRESNGGHTVRGEGASRGPGGGR